MNCKQRQLLPEKLQRATKLRRGVATLQTVLSSCVETVSSLWLLAVTLNLLKTRTMSTSIVTLSELNTLWYKSSCKRHFRKCLYPSQHVLSLLSGNTTKSVNRRCCPRLLRTGSLDAQSAATTATVTR